LIPRYTRVPMGAIWSEESKFRAWLEVETVTSEVLAEDGLVPAEAARAIRERGGFDLDRMKAIEAEVRHDVIAFTTAVAEKVGPEARWLHYGLTSNDVVDTAQALQIKAASAILRDGILRLIGVLNARAIEFQHTPTVGRTHGMHAEPTTFAAEQMRVGKLSGAVGTFGHLSPEHEARICARLGLEPAPIATQVIQRDRHAFYIGTLAVITATLDKIAVEVRHLQRTEVREAEEYFSPKQKGSSAMPHKRNPITAEQISGLARVVRANSQAALENVALWHERDISHSSVERVILPDSTILADYLLDKTSGLIEKLVVYPARMQKNLDSTGGLIFSGQLLLDLAEAGMSREDAYRLVQQHAMNAWQNDLVFRDLVAADPEIAARLSPEKLTRTFDLSRQLANVDAIFARVLAGD